MENEAKQIFVNFNIYKFNGDNSLVTGEIFFLIKDNFI